jgi:hypothetical protein
MMLLETSKRLFAAALRGVTPLAIGAAMVTVSQHGLLAADEQPTESTAPSAARNEAPQGPAIGSQQPTSDNDLNRLYDQVQTYKAETYRTEDQAPVDEQIIEESDVNERALSTDFD